MRIILSLENKWSHQKTPGKVTGPPRPWKKSDAFFLLFAAFASQNVSLDSPSLTWFSPPKEGGEKPRPQHPHTWLWFPAGALELMMCQVTRLWLQFGCQMGRGGSWKMGLGQGSTLSWQQPGGGEGGGSTDMNRGAGLQVMFRLKGWRQIPKSWRRLMAWLPRLLWL